MKKKLLSFFALAVVGILAYAATQISRRAGETVIWSSESATYCTNISIEAEKFADAKVGDILIVEVENTNTESLYNSQVQILNSNGKKLEGGINVGQAADGTLVEFTIVGDVLKQLKAGGMKLGGYGYSSKQVSLKSGDATGSDNAIWVGSVTAGNIDAIDLIHFANANNFTGVKVGDIIRVSFDKTSWVEGTSGWVQLQYKKGSGYTWTQISGEGHSETTVTNPWNGNPVDFVINTAELAAELNDATNNHGLIVQVGGSTTVTSVELIPTYEVTIGEGITGGTVSVDKATAAEGDEVTITATPNEGYKVKSYSVTGVNTNLAVTVNNGKFKMPADAVTVSVTFNQSVDVTIAPASGADISEAIKAAIAELGNNDAKNITINLTEGASYTLSAPLEAYAGLAINGNGATIDASSNEGAFITMSATPDESIKNSNNYYQVDGELLVKDVVVKGVKGRLFYDGGVQYSMRAVTVDNSVIALATASASAGVDFQHGGIKDFTVKNSTIYQTGESNFTNFIRYVNGARNDRLGYGEGKTTMTYTNNTFYKVGTDNWGNYSGISNNSTYDVQKNIWVDCGGSGEIARRIMGNGRLGSGATATWSQNTYWTAGAQKDQGTYDTGADENAPLTTDPNFKDAANGDFAVESTTAQATNKTGDQRWGTWTKPTDIEISPAEGDIYAALTAAKEGVAKVGNITINLTEGASYTLSAPLEAYAGLAINGNGATVDASAVEGALIKAFKAEVPASARRAPETPVEGYIYVDNKDMH